MGRREAERRAWACLLVPCAGLLGACSSYDVSDARRSSLRNAIEAATQSGGYHCAPRELALSNANRGFALLELSQGDPVRAAEHLTLAEDYAAAARLRSPAERCGDAAAAPPAPPLVRAADDDADHDSVPDGDDRCAQEAEDWDGYLDDDGCRDADNDADGRDDARDTCPNAAEDVDGYEDDDGCPDRDNDQDGFDDPADDCPMVPGVAELMGCPRKDYPGLVVAERELRLAAPIAFERNTATIRSVSLPLLDVVAEALRDRPQLTLEIGGHTDSQGDDDANLRLSQEQAVAVARYLSERGVAPARLTARGYGETRPIESNSTSRGRAINRRVELVRTDRAR